MSYISNLSISISTILIFFYLTIIICHFIIDGTTGREWEKEKYIYIIGFILWVLFNIWQWSYLR